MHCLQRKGTKSAKKTLSSSALQTFRIRASCANYRSMGPRPVFPATGRGPMLHLVAAEGRAKIAVFLRLDRPDEERCRLIRRMLSLTSLKSVYWLNLFREFSRRYNEFADPPRQAYNTQSIPTRSLLPHLPDNNLPDHQAAPVAGSNRNEVKDRALFPPQAVKGRTMKHRKCTNE